MYDPTTPKGKKEAIEDLDVLFGHGPRGQLNPACGDGYYSNSLISKWGMSISKLEKEVDYWGPVARMTRARRAFDEVFMERLK